MMDMFLGQKWIMNVMLCFQAGFVKTICCFQYIQKYIVCMRAHTYTQDTHVNPN